MRGVHHVDLVVSSLERSLPFYRDLLGPLGYTSIGEIVGEQGLYLHELTLVRSSLEDAFMTLTASSVEYRAGTAAQEVGAA